jgi:hypothetical protein
MTGLPKDSFATWNLRIDGHVRCPPCPRLFRSSRRRARTAAQTIRIPLMSHNSANTYGWTAAPALLVFALVLGMLLPIV